MARTGGHLPLAVGKNASRLPPSERAIEAARLKVAKALGISKRAAESKHYAGKWRYHIVGKIQRRCGDPDLSLSKWLKHGAPIGIIEPITPGGLFSLYHSPSEAAELDENFWAKGNRPSFSTSFSEEEQPPGLSSLQGYFN